MRHRNKHEKLYLTNKYLVQGLSEKFSVLPFTDSLLFIIELNKNKAGVFVRVSLAVLKHHQEK